MPQLIEVMHQICNNSATYCKAYVMPRQSRLRAHDGWEFGVPYFKLVINPNIVILNSRVFRLVSENLMACVVIATVAHIHAS